jgi:hypothetical protein
MRTVLEPARYAMTGPHICHTLRPGFAYPDDLVGALDAPVYIAQGCVTGTVHNRHELDCYTYASTSEVMLPRFL